MKVVKIKIDEVEKSAIKSAEKRIETLGIVSVKAKAKGGAGRYATRTGLTKGVRSGRMKTYKVDSTKAWKDYWAGKISFAEYSRLTENC